ncbi:MAG: DUF1906 domain-containing protein [Peptococcaceae bacterium]|nr:DUF1906 domain-containing protein [Peptococcaceae bacterium]
MEGMDCATRLTVKSATAVKSAGLIAVGRYLGYKTQSWGKTLTPDEVTAIHAAGLGLFLLWESNPTYAAYFTYAKGEADAKLAVEEADYLVAPQGNTIYFTVDFDAQPANMSAIIDYFRGVRAGITGRYKVGAYGSYSVLAALQNSTGAPDSYYQTYAWSGGKVFAANNIYQYQNSVSIAGIEADRDKIYASAGLWTNSVEQGGSLMETVVIYFSPADYSVALAVANNHGSCAMFCRNGSAVVNPDALKAKVKYTIGGPALNCPGEVYLSGKTAMDTLVVVADAYKAGKV